MQADVPPPRFPLASQTCAVKHHTSLAEGKAAAILARGAYFQDVSTENW